MAQATAVLVSDRCVRIVGEGGSGKSAIFERIAMLFPGSVMVLKDDRVQPTSWGMHGPSTGSRSMPMKSHWSSRRAVHAC